MRWLPPLNLIEQLTLSLFPLPPPLLFPCAFYPCENSASHAPTSFTSHHYSNPSFVIGAPIFLSPFIRSFPHPTLLRLPELLIPLLKHALDGLRVQSGSSVNQCTHFRFKYIKNPRLGFHRGDMIPMVQLSQHGPSCHPKAKNVYAI